MNDSTPQEILDIEASEIQRNGGRSVDGGTTSNRRAPRGTKSKFKDENWKKCESQLPSRFDDNSC